MKKSIRIVGLVVLALVALGGLGYAFGGAGGAGMAVGEPADLLGRPDGTDDVTASIDRALGRPDSGGQPVTGQAGKTVPAASPAAGEAKTAPPKPSDIASSGAATTAVAPTTGVSADALGLSTDRKIVQTASVRLQVKEVGGSFEEVGRIANAAGGFVASSNFALQGDQQVASVTIRVPATRFQEVLSQVRALGAKVDGETSNASDVTEEFSDLAARQRTLDATETQLLQFLGQAKNINEVLQIQDRLNSTRGQIEQVKGRMALLDKLSDLATLTVQLRPVVVAVRTQTGGGHDFGAEISRAWQDSLDFLGGIAVGVLSVAVFAWWVPLIGVPAFVVLQRWSRRHDEGPAVTKAYD